MIADIFVTKKHLRYKKNPQDIMCVQHTEALKSILRFLSTLVNIELSIASVGRKLEYIFSSTNEIHIHFYALRSM